MSPVRLIAMLCTAQVLVQIGAFFWPALLPDMIARWRLTNSEAGWITAAFYGAYMLAVPILVSRLPIASTPSASISVVSPR